MSNERNIFDLFEESPTTSVQTVTAPFERTTAITKSLLSETSASKTKRYDATKTGRTVEIRSRAVRRLQRLRELNQVPSDQGRFAVNETFDVDQPQPEIGQAASIHRDYPVCISSPDELTTTRDWIRRISPKPSSSSTLVGTVGQHNSSQHSQCKLVIEAIARAVAKGEQPQWTIGKGGVSDEQRIAKLSSMRAKRSTNPEALLKRIAACKADALRLSNEKNMAESTSKPTTSSLSAFTSSAVDNLLCLSQNRPSGRSELQYGEGERRRGLRATSSTSSFLKVVAANDATHAVSAVISEIELFNRARIEAVEAVDDVSNGQNTGLKKNKVAPGRSRDGSLKDDSSDGRAWSSKDFDPSVVNFETEQHMLDSEQLSPVTPTLPTAEECRALERLLALCRDALSIEMIDFDDPRWPQQIEAGAVLTIKTQERRLERLKRETKHEMLKQRHLFEALIRTQKRHASIFKGRPLRQSPLPYVHSPTKTAHLPVLKCDFDMLQAGKRGGMLPTHSDRPLKTSITSLAIARRAATIRIARRPQRVSKASIYRLQTPSTASTAPVSSTALNTDSSNETSTFVQRSFRGVSSCILIRTGKGWRKLVKIQPPTRLMSAVTSK
uniref:Uncharacterized protein n=1 Tax=Plectus sambesii TaxID=2011161 RepID=A0A914X248_9BILA